MAAPAFAYLLDAAHVRLAELATALRAERQRTADDHPTVQRLVASLLDLRFGVERAASFPDNSAEQLAVLAYLTETYALSLAYTDPLLHAQLPPLPAGGSIVRYKVLGLNGAAMVLNGNKLVGVGASLAPAPSVLPTL